MPNDRKPLRCFRRKKDTTEPEKKSMKDEYQRWYNDVRLRQICHIKTHRRLTTFNYLIGITIVVLSTFTASSLLTEVTEKDEPIAFFFAVSFGIVTAMLGTLQTSLKLPQLIEKHQKSYSLYGDIRRDIEKTSEDYRVSCDEIMVSKRMEEINIRMDKAASERLSFSQPMFNRQSRKRRKNQYIIFEDCKKIAPNLAEELEKSKSKAPPPIKQPETAIPPPPSESPETTT